MTMRFYHRQVFSKNFDVIWMRNIYLFKGDFECQYSDDVCFSIKQRPSSVIISMSFPYKILTRTNIVIQRTTLTSGSAGQS